MTFTAKPPNPLPPTVRRYDEKGRPLPVLRSLMRRRLPSS